MKCFKSAVIAVLIAALLSTLCISAQEGYVYDVNVKVDGNALAFSDARPCISVEEGRTLVPVRAVSEALGAQVNWDSEDYRVDFDYKGEKISLWIGETAALKNGKTVSFDAPARIMEDRTYVPLRAVVEMFGAQVGWDKYTRTVLIYTTNSSSKLYHAELYSDESPFKQKIPANAQIDPDSDLMMQSVIEAHGDNSFYITKGNWTVYVYFADENTPRHDVELTAGWAPAWNLKNVPIPQNAVPSPGDGHMSIIDMSTGYEYDFWRVENQDGYWTAAWANVLPLYGDGVYPNGYSCRGSGFGLLAGMIWPKELENGKIEHALVFSYPFPKAGGPVSPATESDGDSYREDAIPEGARLQLDPNLDLESFDLTPYEKTIAVALQEYGMILGDNGGSGIEIEAVINPMCEKDNPYEGLLPDRNIVRLNNIPIEHFRVLKLPPQNNSKLKFVPEEFSEWDY